MEKEIKMSKRYIVKLTPTGKFFFGGDMRFGIGKEEEFSSYIIESSTMPQQTSLLGMVRFLLLSNDTGLFDKNNNQIIPGKEGEVKKMIGSESFTVQENKEMNQFGKIKSIGPCFIYNNKKRYYRAPMDKVFSSVEWPVNPTQAYVNGKPVKLPDLKIWNGEKDEFYTGKDYLPSYFVAMNIPDVNVGDSDVYISSGKCVLKGNCCYAEDELFTKDTRIGIDKNYEGKSETNAFYKQISYRLKEGFCFAFEVEVDDDVDLSKELYKGQLVNLGADASSFVFDAEEMNLSENEKKVGLSVVLLSDAYISKNDMDTINIRFSINRIRPFRFLKTENQTNASYYRINGKGNVASRSERYELYQAGSVFYFEKDDDRNAFVEVLESRKDFNQIGYNKYYIKK